MTALRIAGLRKAYGPHYEVVAIDDVDLDVAPGEFVVLLGPSGCGKTTTLRSIAGLEHPDDGSVAIGPDVVFDAARRIDVAPDKRDIGMVFQSYALWPHKTVRKNVEYPLRARRIRIGLQERWVEEALRLVDCEALLDRYPSQLSGGQQQRIALARALVARPGLLLFDEPLSNLDARLRDQVRAELHALHRRLEFTALYVTHDQAEALALATRVAILRAGHIEQLASPREVYESPATDYVAEFIGYTNKVTLERRDRRWRSRLGGLGGLVPDSAGEAGRIVLRIRPEDVSVTRDEDCTDRNHVRFTGLEVLDVTYGGRTSDALVGSTGASIRATVPSSVADRRLADGAQVTATCQPEDIRAFDEKGRPISIAWRVNAPACRSELGI